MWGFFFASTLRWHRIPIVLVGNKSDLHLDRQVSKEDGQKLAQAMKAAFLETSARNNQVGRKGILISPVKMVLKVKGVFLR